MSLTSTVSYMAKQKTRRRREVAEPSPFEQARDEMFQHIMRCGVIGAAPEHQSEWFQETMSYLAERYPELAEGEVTELRTLGERFVQPPKQQADEGADESADAIEIEEPAGSEDESPTEAEASAA